jgi:hypothetical protein
MKKSFNSNTTFVSQKIHWTGTDSDTFVETEC